MEENRRTYLLVKRSVNVSVNFTLIIDYTFT